MKKFLLYQFLLLSVLFAGFTIGFFCKKAPIPCDRIVKGTGAFLEKRKKVPIIESKPMVFVIYSHNNAQWVTKNLQSVFEQNYVNYRIIYIDDSSNDGTYENVEKFVEKNDWQKNVKILKNNSKKGRSACYYETIHNFCKDEEVVIWLEGNDWLASPEVLSILNQAYNDPSIWLTYSSYVEFPDYQQMKITPFSPQVIENNSFRYQPYPCHHLKTFYAGLFKKIKLANFFYEGRFFIMRSGKPAMLTMLEMAKEHHVFIPDVLLIHNAKDVPTKDKDQTKLIDIDHYIQSLPVAEPLLTAPYVKEKALEPSVDLVLFSSDRCMQLHASLESILRYVKGSYRVTVIYKSSNKQYDQGYAKLIQSFPEVKFIKEQRDDSLKEDLFKEIFLSTAHSCPYVMFGVDSSIVKENVDLPDAIEWMEKTKAYAFFLSLGDFPQMGKYVHHNTLEKGKILAWQFQYSKDVWNWPNNISMTIYRKKDIEKDLNELQFTHPNDLRKYWEMKEISNQYLVGICFHSPKAIHMSGYLNRKPLTPDEYLERYIQGFKINLQPVYLLKNQYYHVDQEIELLPITALPVKAEALD